ncbi:MAG: peptidase S10 [Alphaproteobacteria bacterium]|nr:MAG: peptidase S10 [Alphaproteobacteria bacterium]
MALRSFLTTVALAGALAVMTNGTAPAFAGTSRPEAAQPAGSCPALFHEEDHRSQGTVTVRGRRIVYEAVAGTIVVHAKGHEDGVPCPRGRDAKGRSEQPPAEAAMSFVAYFAKKGGSRPRPVTFFFNGGPGSSTVWLHMGAFGPRRVVTSDAAHTPPAPYRLVENGDSLLDVSDLVFIDAPGTGFGRMAGKDAKKAFWGVDQDARAFAEFIQRFLTRFDRWNAPKFLFGESYGTTRAAVLSHLLERRYNIALNGVVMLSQILNFTLSIDGPESNPGVDLAYALALPSFAATAWYHGKLPDAPEKLEDLLPAVEAFATGPYLDALMKGAALSEKERRAVAAQLHRYTGLPVDYILRANLRISGGEFEQTLLLPDEKTTGRLDARFAGPTMDPLAKNAAYDPMDAAIDAAFVAAYNEYARRVLGFPADRKFKVYADVFRDWEFKHRQPGQGFAFPGPVNVMPDLAAAMAYDPNLKLLVTGGYFDLGTPFYAARYEIAHLPMPARLQKNVTFRFYHSGHMIYLHEPSLKALHDDVAAFIREAAAPAGRR